MSATDFMTLFAGLDDAYGTYDPNATKKNPSKGGKVEIKKSARTHRGAVDETLWRSHLEGKDPLGIIAIMKNGLCWWGCIDIDQYDLNVGQVAEAILKHGMPLVPCRTKSGGLHLFIFLDSPAPAEDVQTILRDMAGVLGYGGCEIFPKQSQIFVERGDVGNWLNMPYFGGDATDRYGVKKSGTAMTMVEFIAAAQGVRCDIKSIKVATETENEFSDGPPCLQYLTSVGFTPGMQDNGLFALGTFCKKKYGDQWKEKLEDFNRKYMNPVVSSDNVQEKIKNLSKKEYEYKCKDQPLVSHCNSTLCRTRRYGVGGGKSAYPQIIGLSVLKTEPPIWFMDINEKRVELTTDQLHNYPRFQQTCMEQLHVVFQRLKQDTWLEMVGTVMESLNTIDAPPEGSISGHFEELLYEFCMNRFRAENKSELAAGKPWEDEEAGRYYFRLQDLMEHLIRVRFPWGRNMVSSWIMKRGGQHQFNVQGKLIRTVWVPSSLFEVPVEPELPKTRDVPV